MFGNHCIVATHTDLTISHHNLATGFHQPILPTRTLTCCMHLYMFKEFIFQIKNAVERGDTKAAADSSPETARVILLEEIVST